MLTVENLCKGYPSFDLKDVSFHLPKGYIMGFIGSNGAGKSTTLKSILNIVKPDSGKVFINGKVMSEYEVELKQNIGFMLGAVDYYAKSKICKVVDVYKRFYSEWEDETYEGYIKRFQLDPNKMISELSQGMKVKLGMVLALSHNADLLILDEPTSGLDPVARDELLDLFHEIVEDGEKSILFSTHITSDLDKCADYIIFIKNGELIANSTKDDLIMEHLLIEGKKSDLTQDLKSRMISYKLNSFGFTGLIKRDKLFDYDIVVKENPNLEDLMIYYNKEVII